MLRTWHGSLGRSVGQHRIAGGFEGLPIQDVAHPEVGLVSMRRCTFWADGIFWSLGGPPILPRLGPLIGHNQSHDVLTAAGATRGRLIVKVVPTPTALSTSMLPPKACATRL